MHIYIYTHIYIYIYIYTQIVYIYTYMYYYSMFYGMIWYDIISDHTSCLQGTCSGVRGTESPETWIENPVFVLGGKVLQCRDG